MVSMAPNDHDDRPRAGYRSALWPGDLETVRRLFRDYREWLADHRDSDPEAEPRVRSGLALVDTLIAELPGAYGPPRGEVLLWFEGDDLVACGALRELEPGVGEIKRVHVRSDYRGKAFGIPFVRALIDRARQLGYTRLRADTLASMTAAIEFYQELGFRRVNAFWPHPAAGALFFEREIRE
jgi:GNAT superfamily N-acetyltransferase